MTYRSFRSRAEREAAGWRYPADLHATPCRNCGVPVIWVRSPNNKNVPINADDQNTVHFETCSTSPPPRPAGQTSNGSTLSERQDPAPTVDTSAPLVLVIKRLTEVVEELVHELRARRSASLQGRS